MQWAETFPVWQGTKSVVLILLCLAMVCFPFSVAVTNIFLGLTLATGILSGLWWSGVRDLWHNYRLLFIAMMLYLALVPLGLLWSSDLEWGQRILARHWFWMLLPVVTMALSSERNRNIFLVTTSFGLTVNLAFCVLQANGLIESPAVAGSAVGNATGHIGHTSFGFIYGVWAAWLLHMGLICRNNTRWLLWGLASWAVVMVFLAQGKSGYIVTLVAFLLVAVKWLQEVGGRRMFVSFAFVLLVLSMFAALGPGKERVLGTWEALTGTAQGKLNSDQMVAVSSATARLEWWKMSYNIWLEQPLLGVGTGGFPKASANWQAGHMTGMEFAVPLVHPHNQYLLSMVRWGVVGLLALLALLCFWIRTGTASPWRDRVALPLVTLTGVALLVDGLSTASLEEHFSTIFALILLATGLSEPLSQDV
ncbi:O-antigen ligase family protein [Mariprofundus ferrooxydans]|nr:O-antigen ligase family protein [Mariprofundus ferrooxydans]